MRTCVCNRRKIVALRRGINLLFGLLDGKIKIRKVSYSLMVEG